MEQELLTLLKQMSSPPVFSGVRVTRSFVLCVSVVDRCLSFFFWPLCCLFIYDIRILVTTVVSSNSSVYSTLVVGTDCIGSCKSNYHATTVTTDPVTDDHIYCQFVVVATLPFFLLSWLNTRLLTTDAASGTGNSAPNKFALDFHWFHVVQIAFITVIHFTVNVGSSIMNTTHTF